MSNVLVIFHIQDQNGKPVSGALLSATSTFGPWQGLTDCAGNFNASLQPGHYDVGITANGCAPDVLPADILECGVITRGIVRSFNPAPRNYRGNMCGSRVPGLPPVDGGAANPALVLSWFIDRYAPEDRHRIYEEWHAEGQTDVLISWPDSRVFGQSPEQFGATCAELIANNFYPCVFLYSKDHDPADTAGILANIAPVLPFIVGVVPRVCIGWELSIALGPTTVQELIDALAPQFTAYGCRVYVHFQEGYFAFEQPGGSTSDFWNLNVGKLTGVLHQRDLSWDRPMYQARIVDCLQRFAGGFGFKPESGFGHPFDFIALEITAQDQFNGAADEATGNSWGQTALTAPTCYTSDGTPVGVLGSGNGQ